MGTAQSRYDRLIRDLRSELRPQRVWGEGSGILMVIGHFVVGIAGGAWLLGLCYQSRAALATAFALAALGGVVHLAYLGRPVRFWRMAMRVRTSWVSRGFFGLGIFLAGSLLYLVPQFLTGAPWSADSWVSDVGYGLSFVGMLLLIGYMGFVYAASKAIPFWGSPLHPVLYVAYALRGGAAAMLVAQALGARSSASGAGLLLLWAAVTAAVIVLFVLEIHHAATSGNAAARRSVHDLLAGRMAIQFYGGSLLLGLLLPAWLAWTGLSDALSLWALALLGVASALGDFFMKYSAIRAGVHQTLWSSAFPGRRSPRTP